jgi:GT2 family glycosyltransferase
VQVAQTLQTDAPAEGPENTLLVRALIPCFNRPGDLQLLLDDLAALEPAPSSELSVLVIDNASDPPLTPRFAPNLRGQLLRAGVNSGGSGGFNAGMMSLLASPVRPGATEFLWLLDSDVRLEPGAMRALVEVLVARPDAAAAGSALGFPGSGIAFELGGFVDRRTGEYCQPPPPRDVATPVEVDYVAACSLMVRRRAVERAGLMPDVFINGDDVEWCLRLAAVNRARILAVPGSRARHPHPDRMRTWDRYYASRNAFAPIARLGLGGITHFRRAMRETARAAGQALVGREDLAALHLRGLRDALAGRTTGAWEGARTFRAFSPLDHLSDALRGLGRGPVELSGELASDAALLARLREAGVEPVARSVPRSITGAMANLLVGGGAVAVTSARGRPSDWSPARTVITVCPQGFSVGRGGRWRRLLSACDVLARGTALAVALGLRGAGAPPRIPAAPVAGRPAQGAPPDALPATDLTVVVLSYNRWPALDRTLRTLLAEPGLAGARLLVVDNASTDSSAELVEQHHPQIDVVRLSANQGVAGFNRGVDMADTEFVLILDDDAAPAPGAADAAMELLRRRPDLAAVALHPRHPATRVSEWGFAQGAPCDDWPVMGCANLVRTQAWRAVSGYEEGFFLYRNDTDLAMKLAGAGLGVHFDPAWTAWHDSPAAARKSLRWFELATRNWIWLCRRHGRGLSRVGAVLAGWAWAHREAGLSAAAQWSVLRGAGAGLLRGAPALPWGVQRDGRALRRLFTLRLGRGAHAGTNSASMARHSP